MPTNRRPRRGSLQFAPRKRAAKLLPSVNWKPVSSKEKGLLGFIVYKAGMTTAYVKDTTPKVMSSGKQIAIPVTILEAPNMKIFSIRFYYNGLVTKEVIVSNDKELKKKLKVPKTLKNIETESPERYDDIRAIVYTLAKTTSIKKSPDFAELAVQGDSPEEKLQLLKSLIGKEISPFDTIKFNLADVRGVTKGKGIQGPIKRFGAKLRFHKTEKGQRKVGSIGPWHPAHVSFRTPMAGQMGTFTRIIHNVRILSMGRISEKNINPSAGFSNYGKLKTSYIILSGSVPGPAKRQTLLTPAFRPSKLQAKKKLEFLEVVAK